MVSWAPVPLADEGEGFFFAATAANAPSERSGNSPRVHATDDGIWERRCAKRQMLLAALMNDAEYKNCRDSIPPPPDATDRSMSKRKWEKMMMQWRATRMQWARMMMHLEQLARALELHTGDDQSDC
jgi:hypothetical protein